MCQTMASDSGLLVITKKNYNSLGSKLLLILLGEVFLGHARKHPNTFRDKHLSRRSAASKAASPFWRQLPSVRSIAGCPIGHACLRAILKHDTARARSWSSGPGGGVPRSAHTGPRSHVQPLIDR